MRRVVVEMLLRYEAVPVWGRWAAALAWAVLLWVLSGRPGEGGPSHPFWNWAANGAHFGAYGVLCVLVFLAVAARPRARAILSVALAFAYGILDEVRVIGTAREACWIRADHASQASGSTFVTVTD